MWDEATTLGTLGWSPRRQKFQLVAYTLAVAPCAPQDIFLCRSDLTTTDQKCAIVNTAPKIASRSRRVSGVSDNSLLGGRIDRRPSILRLELPANITCMHHAMRIVARTDKAGRCQGRGTGECSPADVPRRVRIWAAIVERCVGYASVHSKQGASPSCKPICSGRGTRLFGLPDAWSGVRRALEGVDIIAMDPFPHR